jgi:hypothetical protein
MPMITSSSARAPFSASSLPTCGPTNSTRRSVGAAGAFGAARACDDRSPTLAVF